MSTPGTEQTSDWSSRLESFLQQLQQETILLATGGVFLMGMAVIAATRQIRDSILSILFAAALFLLTFLIWLVRRWSYLISAFLLVIGTFVAVIFLVAQGGVSEGIYLLAVPVGLATLTISRNIGIASAGLVSLLLLFAPASLLPEGTTMRGISLVLVWSTVGMIWLTLRPLLEAVSWSWSGYEKSRSLLEESREYQVKLSETLEDLTYVNLQLTRLNRQTAGLRQIAEEERHAKEQFVANVSHELRTPLNMIIGFGEMMTRSPETYKGEIPRALLADLDVIVRNSQHLSNLVDDVLDLSQIQARQMALTKERVSLAELVHASSIAVRPLLESKGLYLKIDIPDDIPEIFCDRTRIREVMLNLLSNAGRFTEEGGIHVQARREGDFVVVSVADTGPGIAEADKGRLFQPFQQADNTIRRRFGGTGLGLSISKSFVELHGGKMWIESQPGEGTVVLYRLPVDTLQQIPRSAASQITPGWEFLERVRPAQLPEEVGEVPPRIVVVEKGDALQRLLGRYFDGVEISPVSNLEEAAVSLSEIPALALLINDLNVGGELQEIYENAQLPYNIPVIICSVPDVEEAADSFGATAYLVKPISREFLLDALKKIDREIKTILIVDDEPDARRLFRRMLTTENGGYRVVRASNGIEALAILSQQPVDVIFLDLMMPEMDGFQFLQIREQEPALREIPVILISALDPLGQPIVSKSLAVTSRDGLSVADLVASIEALSAILSKKNLFVDPESKSAPPD